MIRVQNGKGCGGTFPERCRNLKLAVKLEVALARNFTVVFCPRAGMLAIFIRKILMDISCQYFSSSGHAMKKGELSPRSFHNRTHFQERTKQGLSPPTPIFAKGVYKGLNINYICCTQQHRRNYFCQCSSGNAPNAQVCNFMPFFRGSAGPVLQILTAHGYCGPSGQ